MKTPTTFEITADLQASIERDGGTYTGNLIVRSEKLDDCDIYRLDPEGGWDSVFDSLTRKTDQLELPDAAAENSGGWTGWLWEELDGFSAWARGMKALVPAAARRARTPRRYYAVHWPCGYGATSAEDGANWVAVYGFDSAAARDAACAEYRAPNHCPTARLEPALASATDVARAIRGTRHWGDSSPTRDVRNWGDV